MPARLAEAKGGGEQARRAHQVVLEPSRAAANAAMRPDQPALLSLGTELIQVGRPVGAAGRVRGAATVPSADAGDQLVLVAIRLDDVAERLGLAVAHGWAGQGGRTTRHWGPLGGDGEGGRAPGA